MIKLTRGNLLMEPLTDVSVLIYAPIDETELSKK